MKFTKEDIERIEKCITRYNDKKKEKDLKSRGANNVKVKNGIIYE